MKSATFHAVARDLAATIGRQSGVRVTFGGKQAWACKDQVHLPALPAGTTISREMASVMRGYLDHEVGHVRYSDFDALESAEVKEQLEKAGLKRIWNYLEDPRQENCYLADYPGADRWLGSVHGFMDGKAREAVMEERAAGIEPTLAEAAMCAIHREAWRHRGLYRYCSTALSLEQLGLGEVQRLIDEGFPRLRSSLDALALARKIYDALEQECEEFEGQGEAGAAGGAAGGDSGDSEAGEPGSAPGTGAPKGSSEWKAGEPDGQLPAEAGSLDGGPDAADDSSAMDEILQEIAREQRGSVVPESKQQRANGTPNPWIGDRYLPPATTEHDRIFVPSEEDMDRYLNERANLGPAITAAKKALGVLLRSRQRRAWSRGLEEGLIDDDRLPDHAVTGTTSIRKARRERTFPNTAIAVLLDLSNSMDSSLVRQAGICLAEALQQLPKAKVRIAGFTTNGHYPARPATNPPPPVGRCDGLDVLMFKDFDESYRECAPRLGAIETENYTPLGEGYAHGFEALVARSEHRRALVVVTDGKPYYHHNWHSADQGDPQHNDFVLLEDVHRKARYFGILTMGIGVKDRLYGGSARCLRRFVDTFRMIDGVEDLPQAMLDLASDVMVPL